MHLFPEKNMDGYRNVLKQRQYMKLLCANIINRFGDSVDAITFTWLIYAITGSASWSAVIFGLNQLPSMLVQPLAGAWVETADKKKVMAITDIIRGLLVTAFALAYFFNTLTPWLMAGITLAISTAEAFRIPAGTGIIPQIIDLKYYSFGNSLNTTASRLVEIMGTGLSAVILATVGIRLTLAIDILSYFISAGIILTIHPVFGKNFSSNNDRTACKSLSNGFQNYIKALKEGLCYVKKHPLILNFCFLGVAANGMLVPLNALMTPIITEIWGQGAPMLSIFGTALTIGMCVGGFIYPYISRDKNPRTFITTGGFIMAAAYAWLSAGGVIRNLGTAAIEAAPMLLAAIALGLGLGLALISSAFGVSLVKCIAKDYLSRVSSLVNAAASAAMPVISLIVSLCAIVLCVPAILFIGALLFALTFLIIAIRKTKFQ